MIKDKFQSREICNDYRRQLHSSRASALANSEDFSSIIHIIERIGSFLCGSTENLGRYKENICELASFSYLAEEVPSERRRFHTPFNQLYKMVVDGRNGAAHSGAIARSLTKHAIEISLILEDALMSAELCGIGSKISDVMVRNPSCAALWHPVSFVRQQMLVNLKNSSELHSVLAGAT